MQIYYYGCRCGTTVLQISLVKTHYPDTEVFNSKYDSEAKARHVNYLADKGSSHGSYPAIVVNDGNVVLLKSWQP